METIQSIEEDISLYKQKEYKKYHPYTPEYALSIVTTRVRLDIGNSSIIEKLERQKESCILELKKLYPEKNYQDS